MKRSKYRWKPIRAALCGLIFVLVVVGLVLHTGTGTLSSFGVSSIAAVCPLGMLETFFTGRNLNIHALILLVVAIVLVLIFGKAFCSWLCPTPHIRNFFRRKKKDADEPEEDESIKIASGAIEDNATEQPAEKLGPVGGKRDGLHLDSRHFVLGGALLSSLIFGFPVFCLVCPVGLSFATVIAVFNLFRFSELSFGILVFPLIILIEVALFGKWCTKFCPLSALMSLISRVNKTFKPEVDQEACLRTQGVDCHTCVETCPEEVDPHTDNIPECTKCGECMQSCPAEAIRLKIVKGLHL